MIETSRLLLMVLLITIFCSESQAAKFEMTPCSISLAELRAPKEPSEELIGSGTILEIGEKIFMRFQEGKSVSRPTPADILPAYRDVNAFQRRYAEMKKGAKLGEPKEFVDTLAKNDLTQTHFALKPGMILLVTGDPGMNSFLFRAPTAEFTVYRKEGGQLVKTELSGSTYWDMLLKSSKLLRKNQVETYLQINRSHLKTLRKKQKGD